MGIKRIVFFMGEGFAMRLSRCGKTVNYKKWRFLEWPGQSTSTAARSADFESANYANWREGKIHSCPFAQFADKSINQNQHRAGPWF
jgi:hypothetical protein